MNGIWVDGYGRWRAEHRATDLLHDGSGRAAPAERLLQQIWHHQRLQREHLMTVDGRPLRVLHPGFWNREAGPDFRDALIQLDNGPACSGDVEIDRQTGGWHGHSHHRNPDYGRVILHVVWDATGRPDLPLPTLALEPVLDAPVEELAAWLGSLPAETFPDTLRGRCCLPLRALGGSAQTGLLEQLALVRLRQKAFRCYARARQVGWDQALWEGMFRALGYRHNIWPMQRLAELIFPVTRRQPRPAAFAFQAILLGVGNLLPDEWTPTVGRADDHWRRLWDAWWRVREEFVESILPRRLWRLNGVRPANHPQRRLALAAHWLARHEAIAGRLELWFATPLPRARWAAALRAALEVEADEFWSWHWTFRSRRLSAARPLLGAARVTDLSVNAVLPWFWMRAVAGKNEPLRQAAEERYLGWPKAQDNSVLRLARQRLLSGPAARSVRSAAAQQGLIQIVRDFCSESNAVCDHCLFPAFVRDFEFHSQTAPEAGLRPP